MKAPKREWLVTWVDALSGRVASPTVFDDEARALMYKCQLEALGHEVMVAVREVKK